MAPWQGRQDEHGSSSPHRRQKHGSGSRSRAPGSQWMQSGSASLCCGALPLACFISEPSLSWETKRLHEAWV
jgi:hypothetical protein